MWYFSSDNPLTILLMVILEDVFKDILDKIQCKKVNMFEHINNGL
jgi:hypothetical protein